MSKLLISAAAVLTVGALATTPVAAHPENDIKPINQCDKITPAQWNQVRQGMSLSAVEHILGCHGGHHQTVEFKAGPLESYHFKTGTKILVRITFRDGKLRDKYGYYSGL